MSAPQENAPAAPNVDEQFAEYLDGLHNPHPYNRMASSAGLLHLFENAMEKRHSKGNSRNEAKKFGTDFDTAVFGPMVEYMQANKHILQLLQAMGPYVSDGMALEMPNFTKLMGAFRSTSMVTPRTFFSNISRQNGIVGSNCLDFAEKGTAKTPSTFSAALQTLLANGTDTVPFPTCYVDRIKEMIGHTIVTVLPNLVDASLEQNIVAIGEVIHHIFIDLRNSIAADTHANTTERRNDSILKNDSKAFLEWFDHFMSAARHIKPPAGFNEKMQPLKEFLNGEKPWTKQLRVLSGTYDQEEGKGEGCILTGGAHLAEGAGTLNLWHLIKVVLFLGHIRFPLPLVFNGGFAQWFLIGNFLPVVLGHPVRPRAGELGFNWLIWGGKPYVRDHAYERRSHHTNATSGTFFKPGTPYSKVVARIWELQFRWGEIYDTLTCGNQAIGKQVLEGYTFGGKIAKIQSSKSIKDVAALTKDLEQLEREGKEKEAAALQARIEEILKSLGPVNPPPINSIVNSQTDVSQPPPPPPPASSSKPAAPALPGPSTKKAAGKKAGPKVKVVPAKVNSGKAKDKGKAPAAPKKASGKTRAAAAAAMPPPPPRTPPSVPISSAPLSLPIHSDLLVSNTTTTAPEKRKRQEMEGFDSDADANLWLETLQGTESLEVEEGYRSDESLDTQQPFRLRQFAVSNEVTGAKEAAPKKKKH